jgi:hypothetical protein
MADSEFWRNLAKEFRALPKLGTEFRADRWLSISGEVPPQPPTWSVSCSNRSVEQQWKALAKRGGDALSENDTVDSVFVWLEVLWKEKVNAITDEYFDDNPSGDAGVMGRGIRESITALDEAAPVLCGIMENAELDRERYARAVKAQQGVSQQAVEAPETPPAPLAEPEPAVPPRPSIPPNERRKVVEPLLDAKGWSVFEWANEAKVAHATAIDYLDLKTNPYPSTRLKLANALGIPQDQLPQ